MAALIDAGVTRVVVGSLAAFRAGGFFDRFSSIVSLVGASVPDFWLAIVAINNAAQWKNPLPHISSVRRTYGTYSLPLLLASAVALENYRPSEVSTRELTERFRTDISKALPDALIAGELEKSMAHLTSLVIPRTNGEELLRELDRKGFAVDSGSACTAMNLQPSHVLSAMGLPTDGNIRIAIHTETTLEEITGLVNALVSAVQSQQQR